MSSTAVAAAPRRSLSQTALSLALLFGVLLLLVGVFGLVLSSASGDKLAQQNRQLGTLASDQRTRVETMAKDALAIESGIENRRPDVASANDFAATVSAYDQTLKAFVSGGKAAPLNGESVDIKAIADPALAVARQLQGVWLPVDAKAVGGSGGAEVAAQTLLAAEPALRDGSDKLVQALSEQAGAGAHGSSYPLVIVGMLGLVMIIASLFSRLSDGRRRVNEYAKTLESVVDELQSSSRELADAKRGSDIIMQTVNEGLFLIDSEFHIQPQYSKELEKIFQTEDLADRDLLQLVQGLLTERLFNTTRDYLALLFDPSRKERALIRVNPLDEVECSFPNPTQGGFTSKFLSFTFRRVIEGGKVVRAFVSVNDISDRVQLERQLRDAEQKKERQFELLLSILHIDGRALDEFITTTKEQIYSMNDALRAQDFAAAGAGNLDLLRQRLDAVFRNVHNIKGNAALIKFDYFQKRAESFEDKLSDLRGRMNLGGDDFLTVVIAQSELRTDIEELEDLRGKFAIAPASTASARSAAEPVANDELVESIEELAKTLASRLHKEVRVDAQGFDTRDLAPERRRAIRDTLIQFTRNSLTHGVEEPAARLAAGKDRYATITIRKLSAGAQEFGFVFRDDGRGFDTQRIRQRAVERGLVPLDEAGAYDDSAVIGFIFEPGFSTADETTEDAGRGMGMDIVKQRIVDECGGEISVMAHPGQFCEFKIVVPTAEIAHA